MLAEIFLVYFRSVLYSFKNTLSEGVRNSQRGLSVWVCFLFFFLYLADLVKEKNLSSSGGLFSFLEKEKEAGG